ncbi:MAG: DNA primase [Dinghuibacter sp.]|nr:DNA primase [Dinghuibacter sp.]
MISKDTIQQILNRLDIVEVVNGFVKLKKRGTNYLGLCPFHNEKTPSFTVSPAKEIYKCFGCGKSGNTISFLMEHEKLTYAEALKWLAAKYNVTVEETELSPEQKQQAQVSESLFIINQFAQQYFAETLVAEGEGRNVGLSYFEERGFTEATIKKFGLGYCTSERDAFARTALANQYNEELLLKTGLVTQRDGQLADNYRGRVIFPIHNQTGKVCGFGARIIKKNDRAPKYINTPENEVYNKSRLLYGMWFARQAIDRQNECYLVEGYTDVLSLHQNGVENTVASGGTSLTPDQLRLVKKHTKNLTILYDGDAAGIKAALRGLDLALEEGLNVKVALIPDGHDPDSYIRLVGANGFTDFINKEKKDVILFQLQVMLKDAGDDSQKKSALVNQVAETISRINKVEDFTRQQDYIRRSAQILNIDEAGLHSLVNKFIREKISKQEQRFPVEEELQNVQSGTGQTPPPADYATDLFMRDELQERNIVRVLIESGMKPWEEGRRVADYLLEEVIDTELFENRQLISVIEQYKQWYDEGREPTARDFLYSEDKAVSALVVSLIAFPYDVSPNWGEKFDMPVPERDAVYLEDVTSSSHYLKMRKIKRLIEENQKDLEQPHSDEELKTVLQYLHMLIETHELMKQQQQELSRRTGTVIYE